jgi:hypothetical protein
MVIIMANSWAGTPTPRKGDNRRSIPSVRLMGFVVRVSMEEPMIRSTNLSPMKKALYRPSFVTVKNQILANGSPLVINIFTVKVNRIMKKMGFSPLKINLRGTFEKKITRPRQKTTKANPMKSLTKKSEIIYAKVHRIFVLGSSL